MPSKKAEWRMDSSFRRRSEMNGSRSRKWSVGRVLNTPVAWNACVLATGSYPDMGPPRKGMLRPLPCPPPPSP
jgi:hypothetical protein